MANIFDEIDPPKNANIFDQIDPPKGVDNTNAQESSPPEREQKIRAPKGIMEDAWHNIGKPLIEGSALVAGGVAGTMLSAPTLGAAAPVLGTFGAGLMYAQAKEFTSAIDKKMAEVNGEDYNDPGIKGQMLDMLANARDGMMNWMLGESAGTAAMGLIKPILAPGAKAGSNPEQVLLRQSAKNQGITLSPGEATGSKTMRQIEGMMYNAPGSADVVERFQKTGLLDPMLKRRDEILSNTNSTIKDIDAVGQQIYYEVGKYLKDMEGMKGDALNDMRNTIIGKLGAEDTSLLTGLKAKDRIAAQSQIIMDRKNALYQEAAEAVKKVDKGEAIYEVPNMRQTSQEIIDKESRFPKSSLKKETWDWLNWSAGKEKISPKTKEMLDSLPEDLKDQFIETVKSKEPGLFSDTMDLETLIDTRRKLNSLIKDENISLQKGTPGFKGQLSTDGQVLQRLKTAVDNDIRQIIEATGGEAKTKLDIADTFFVTQVQEGIRKDVITKMAFGDPQKIVDIALRPNGITNIQLTKKVLGEDGFNETLKPLFTRKITGIENGEWNPSQLKSALRSYGDEFMLNVYTPAELNFLKETASNGFDVVHHRIPTVTMAKIIADKTPNLVVDAIVGGPGTNLSSTNLYKNITLIKDAISKDAFDNLGNQVMDKIFQVNPKTGYLPPASFSSMVAKYTGSSDFGRNVLKLFDFPAGNLEALQELADVAGKASMAQRLAAPGSITAPNQVTWGAFNILIKNPITKKALALAPWALSKIWYTPGAMRYLVDGFKLPAGSKEGIANAVKLFGVINSEDLKKQQQEIGESLNPLE
jgi:hypothetical protein